MGVPAFARSHEDETERYARMTPEERLRLFLEICDLTDSIVSSRPDAEAIRAPSPRSPRSEALWASLMRRSRGEHASR